MRIALGILVACLSLAPALPQTIGLAPASGIDPAPGGAAPAMDSMVSACLGILFDSGLIATDAPCASVGREAWQAPSFGLAAAEEGLEDYLIAVFADWRPNSFKKGAWTASGIDYRLVRVSDGATMAAGSLEGPADTEEAAESSDRLVGDIGAAIGKACAAALGISSAGGKR